MRRALSSIIISTSLLSFSAFAAQADVPSNPNIWAAVQDLQASQASQNATLSSIQTTLNSLIPPAQGNVRYTPPVSLISQGCQVANVSATPKTVTLEQLFGNVVVATLTQTIEPGALANLPRQFASYCRFTVQDGTRSNIRGTALIFVESSGPVSFAVPAE